METNDDYAAACFAGSTHTDGEGPGCRCTSDPVTGEASIDPGCETHNGPKPPPLDRDLTTEECEQREAAGLPMVFMFPSGLDDGLGNTWHPLLPDSGDYFGWNIRDGFRYRDANPDEWCPHGTEPGHAAGDTWHHHAEGGRVCWSCGFIPHKPPQVEHRRTRNQATYESVCGGCGEAWPCDATLGRSLPMSQTAPMSTADYQRAWRARQGAKTGQPGRPVTQPCGTPAAFRRHKRNGEEPCDACTAAEKQRQAALYAARKARG